MTAFQREKVNTGCQISVSALPCTAVNSAPAAAQINSRLLTSVTDVAVWTSEPGRRLLVLGKNKPKSSE